MPKVKTFEITLTFSNEHVNLTVDEILEALNEGEMTAEGIEKCIRELAGEIVADRAYPSYRVSGFKELKEACVEKLPERIAAFDAE